MRGVFAEEIVETIKRSSLRTVIAEGKDETIVSRPLEARCSDLSISFMSVGGKGVALAVWEGLPENVRSNCALWLDQDLWIFAGVPQDFPSERGILTDGYSIENDLFGDFDFCQLMTADERDAFEQELKCVCDWFGHVVERHLDGDAQNYRRHPSDVLHEHANDEFDSQVDIYSDYGRKLRGKTLFQLLLRQLSRKGRRSKYSNDNLLEMGAMVFGPKLRAVESRVREIFS